MTLAIVLAGGASSRFGGDKLAAEVDGRPLLHHALEAVAQVADGIVLVIAPAAPVPVLPAAHAARVRVARDPVALGGPLAGLAAGLAAIAGATLDAPIASAAGAARAHDRPPPIALVVGGDMPQLVPAVLRRLVDRLAAQDDLAAINLEASPPSPLPMAIRPDRVREAIDESLAGGRRSLRSLLEAVASASVAADEWEALDPDRRTLRDVDTIADLRPG